MSGGKAQAAEGANVDAGAPAAPVEQPYPSIDHTVPSLPPLPEPTSRRSLWIAIMVVVLAVVAITIGILASGGSPEDDLADPGNSGEPGGTTIASSTTVPIESSAPSTTVPATTEAESTTTTTTTTIATTAAILTLFDAIGDPVPISELSLGAFAIGPFDFDAPADNPIGRLVATFGQPDDLETADESWGLCPDEAGRAITWGPLTIVTRGTDDEILVAYRLGPFAGSDAQHPAAAMTTLSGLAVGDATRQLEAIYANSTVDFADIDGVASFRLLRSGDDRLLLWGPVVEDTIAAIYSPRPCDQGP